MDVCNKAELSAMTPNWAGSPSSGREPGGMPGCSAHQLPSDVLLAFLFPELQTWFICTGLLTLQHSERGTSSKNDNNNNGKAMAFLST